MSEEKKKPNSIDAMKKSVKRLTKLIGQASERNDFGEASNLRNQRLGLLKKLGEVNIYYWIEDGKSKFGSQDEFEEYHSDPEKAEKAKMSIAAANYIAAWTEINGRHETFTALKPEDVKAKVLEELAKELEKIEKVINKLHEKVGKKAIDFKAVRENKAKDGTDGIDWSSLLDEKDNK